MENVESAFGPADRIGQLTMRLLDLEDSRDKLELYGTARPVARRSVRAARGVHDWSETRRRCCRLTEAKRQKARAARGRPFACNSERGGGMCSPAAQFCGEGGSPSRARTLVSCPECRRSPHSRRPAAAPRSTRPRGSRRFSLPSSRRSVRPPRRASIPPTTRPSTASTTNGRSCSRSTSSRPSSTIRAPSVPSPRRTRSTTSSRWAALPLLALSVTAFPEELPTEMLGEMLAGADEAVRAAGAILAGGHTIRDDEPKYGLAVVGTVHPDRDLAEERCEARRRSVPHEAARHRARPPGAAGRSRARRRARRRGRRDEDANRAAADALRPFAPNAVTDVTGFGLLGHAHEMASRSGVRVVLDAGGAAGAPRGARAGRGRGAHGRRPAQPRVRGPARRRRPPQRPPRRWRTTRRRRAAS